VTAATEIWTYRNLIYNLAQRELRSRYKKSVLGWAWSLINPASTLVIFSLVFGVFLKQIPPPFGNGDTGVFALYLFAGLVIWNFFNATINGSITALQSSGQLLNKVYFPPSCPAIANLMTVVLQGFIEASILAVVMVALGNVSITFLFFPFTLLLLAPFALGIGLAVSIFNVYLRDVGYLVSIGMNLLFYATPIVYPVSSIPEEKWGLPLQTIFSLNPVAQFVSWSRDAFYLLRWPSLTNIAVMALVSFGTFALGWSIFSWRSKNVTEEL
jgi:ABC-2 type transport system permease protein